MAHAWGESCVARQEYDYMRSFNLAATTCAARLKSIHEDQIHILQQT